MLPPRFRDKASHFPPANQSRMRHPPRDRLHRRGPRDDHRPLRVKRPPLEMEYPVRVRRAAGRKYSTRPTSRRPRPEIARCRRIRVRTSACWRNRAIPWTRLQATRCRGRMDRRLSGRRTAGSDFRLFLRALFQHRKMRNDHRTGSRVLTYRFPAPGLRMSRREGGCRRFSFALCWRCRVGTGRGWRVCRRVRLWWANG